ncbi:MAG TPA: GldG family protein [Candidatus Acidoferrales bacterium]|nr:GldG family protein [Candidatus Acidoferrales bacterium]
MRAYGPIAGVAGAVLTAFGLIALFFTADPADPYVLSHLGLGLSALLVFAVGQGRALVSALRQRAVQQGLHSLTYTLLFVGVLVLVNFLNTRYQARWDVTENKVFSLSPQSVKVVSQLQQDLEIYGFFERGENPKVSDLVRAYAYHSPRIKFEAVDPDRHPELARRFKIQQRDTLHLRYGKQSMNVTDANEETLTNAIIKLTKARKKTVYFLTGHGEPRLDDRETPRGYAAAKEALENENYQVKETLLASQEKVPDDASALIVAAPEKPLTGHELSAIDAYMKNGGRLLLMPPPTDNPSLRELVKDWGVRIGDDIVVDQVIRLFAGPSLGIEPIADTYSAEHPITRDFRERTIFPTVRSVEPTKSPKDGVQSMSLVRTAETSWAENDVSGVFKEGRAAFGPEDKKGPVSVAVAASASLKKLGVDKNGDAKVVVIGTAEFANNRFINIFFNRDFFLNVVNWLAGEEELISIRPRAIRSSKVQFTESEGKAVFYLSFLLLPEILLIVGLSVWWRRR